MSTSNQKIVQSYMERHGIGQLFEDMMAKIIKDMPNEPIVFLIKLLQKVHQRKNGHPENTFPSSTVYKSDMGLIGSSIPKKYSNDPQVVLPGSKSHVSTWAVGDSDSIASDESKSIKQRDYEKPWLAGKPPKGPKDKKGQKHEYKSWNTETKVTTKSFDDLFEQQSMGSREKPMSKSLPVGLHETAKQAKEKDSTWSETYSHENKENKQPYKHRKQMACDDNDELKIESNQKSQSKKITISPTTYSKYKKLNSKKKSVEQKQKLQALLSNENPQKGDKDDQDDESTDDDSVEVMENNNDLVREGVKSKKSTGIKRPIHKSSEKTGEVKVGVCSRCARMIGDNVSNVNTRIESNNNGLSDSDHFFKPKSKNQFSDIMQSDDDDFESVSQINKNKPYRPSWPTISDSEGDDVENVTAKLKLTDPPSKSPFTKGVNLKSTGVDTDKSDFFERNSPLRKKTKQLSGNFTSDNESDVGVAKPKKSPRHSMKPKQAWRQQIADTGSDADVEEDLQDINSIKGRGWKQKHALADDASDVL